VTIRLADVEGLMVVGAGLLLVARGRGERGR
jgi:hypothetical protein